MHTAHQRFNDDALYKFTLPIAASITFNSDCECYLTLQLLGYWHRFLVIIFCPTVNLMRL